MAVAAGGCPVTLDPEFPKLLRRLLVEEIAALPQHDVAVAASAGVSSTSLVLAARDAGKAVTAFSFALEGHESQDLAAARDNAATLGLPFVRVDLPLDLDRLVEDVRYIVGFRVGLGFKTKKAATECSWPWLYLLDAVQGASIGGLVVGLGDDEHFGLTKREMLNFRYPREAFDEFRRLNALVPDPSQVDTVRALARFRKIEIRAPYLNPAVASGLLAHGWDDLNKPRQKEPVRLAFPELGSLRVHRHANFQLGDSGIARNFERLSPLFGGLRPVAIYNRIAKEVMA